MLNIGMMRNRITLQRKSETVADSGSVTPAWTDIVTVWAEVVQQSASEFLTGFGDAETGTLIFRIRFRDDLTTADYIAHWSAP